MSFNVLVAVLIEQLTQSPTMKLGIMPLWDTTINGEKVTQFYVMADTHGRLTALMVFLRSDNMDLHAHPDSITASATIASSPEIGSRPSGVRNTHESGNRSKSIEKIFIVVLKESTYLEKFSFDV